MNILITGSNGQLGSELIKTLSDGKSEIGSLPSCFQNVCASGVDVDMLDVSDACSIHNYFADKHFDIIINCAAMTNVDACESDFESAMKVNVIGAHNLAAVASAMDCKFVHISTDYVFNGVSDKPFAEWDFPAPNTVYGKSKLLGERYVREECSKSFIIRTSWLYGHTGNNFVKTIVRLAKEKDELKVVADQRGNPTNVADLAHHIFKIAATQHYGLYHCTGNGECSWYDFACEITRLSGIQCKIAPCTTAEFPRPAPRPAYSALDNLMLRCTVGDEMRPWKDALTYFLQNYK